MAKIRPSTDVTQGVAKGQLVNGKSVVDQLEIKYLSAPYDKFFRVVLPIFRSPNKN